jgi:hypothetical protein
VISFTLITHPIAEFKPEIRLFKKKGPAWAAFQRACSRKNMIRCILTREEGRSTTDLWKWENRTV